MPKKQRKPYDHSLLLDRLAFLRETLWGGSQSKMALELGIQQGSLSNILTGKREAGREFVARLAEHPLVNATWLRTGVGAPLAEEGVSPALGEAVLYVVRELFEGTPDENRDKLERHLLPVHRSLHRVSRYWEPIHQGHPLLADKSLRIAENDIVLFDSDLAGWPADLRGHPCIVRVGRGKSSLLGFATCLKRSGSHFTAADFNLLGSLAKTESRSTASLPEPRPKGQKAIEVDPELSEPSVSHKGDSHIPVRIVSVGIYREGGFASNDVQ